MVTARAAPDMILPTDMMLQEQEETAAMRPPPFNRVLEPYLAQAMEYVQVTRPTAVLVITDGPARIAQKGCVPKTRRGSHTPLQTTWRMYLRITNVVTLGHVTGTQECVSAWQGSLARRVTVFHALVPQKIAVVMGPAMT